MDLSKIRNIGIAAHIDAGKTTTTECVLFYAGRIHRIGTVDEGNTTMDWMVQERERGITITSAVTYCEWNDHVVNLIDTPGHVDFTVEVERSLRVLDGVIVIFCGVGGVEPQSETIWRQCDRYRVPRVVYVNKLDRVGSDFYRVVDEIKKDFGTNAVPMFLPYGKESGFSGVIDLLNQKLIVYADDLGMEMQELEIPDDLKEHCQLYREKLIEAVAETNDELMHAYLEGKALQVQDIKKAIREATIASKLVPVYCGASFKKKGVQPLLDGVVDYLPSPLDIAQVKAHSVKDEKEIFISPENPSFSALAFKVATDPHVGKVVYFRVYSGTLKAGTYIYNATKKKRERVSRILRMHADRREDVPAISAGDFGALVGLKYTQTGDTLCEEDKPLLLESIQFPEPVVSVAIEPKSRADQEKLGLSLAKLEEEDPTFKKKFNDETGQMVISGMGELHLEIICDRLLREFSVEANIGKPQVAYKETIRKKSKAEGKYVRQSGGRGQYGHVVLEVEPLPPGSGQIFESKIIGGAIPREYFSAVEAGVREAQDAGIKHGFQVVDVKVRLVDGSYHEVDSSEIAFKIAASEGFKNACLKASPVLLEPVMQVDVLVPDDYLGDVLSDIPSRRGRIEEISDAPSFAKCIKAFVPLSNMFGYATDLRSITQGRATYTMQFARYEEMPQDIIEKFFFKEKELIKTKG